MQSTDEKLDEAIIAVYPVYCIGFDKLASRTIWESSYCSIVRRYGRLPMLKVNNRMIIDRTITLRKSRRLPRLRAKPRLKI